MDRGLAGYTVKGSQRSDMAEQLNTHTRGAKGSPEDLQAESVRMEGRGGGHGKFLRT